ncbi:MAG: efflux RND transporter periplasmic adaptor subunit [Minwuia sp.]|uniref:efflux RND transporter periplasmic adaptor subunit n=1 Tax=Minwuia sp. TaxID=2493630 RepID=UPI003A85FADE
MRILIQILVVAILAVAGIFAFQNRAELPLIGKYFAPPAQAQRGGGFPTPVDAVILQPGVLVDSVRVVGTARSNQSVAITSEIAGRIADMNISEGQQVQKGDVLVRFGSAEIAADLAGARSALKLAQQIYERGEATRRKGLTTEARTEELAQAVATAEAEVRQLEVRIGKFTLQAPFSGRLGFKQASLGALVQPGDPIVTLDDISVIKLDFDVPETALAALHPGQTVLARSSAYPDTPIEGVVSTIDTRVDPDTRSVTVRAEIDNAEGLLRPGMYLTVELVYGRTENALLAPEELVLVVDGGAFVFAVEDGKAVRSPVTLGRRRPGQVEILDGLEAGQTVITAGVQKVRPGAAVQVRNAPKGAES